MARKIGQITQSDCYINEVDVCGRVTELDMGEIAHAEIEHQTLGMIGVLKLPGRPVQAIDGKITFEWLDEEVSRNILNPTKVHKLQLHSYVDVFDGEGLNSGQSHTLITHIGFQMMKTVAAPPSSGNLGRSTISPSARSSSPSTAAKPRSSNLMRGTTSIASMEQTSGRAKARPDTP